MDEQNVEVIITEDCSEKNENTDAIQHKVKNVINVAKEKAKVVIDKTVDTVNKAKSKVVSTTGDLKNKTNECVALTRLNVENCFKNLKDDVSQLLSHCQELGQQCIEKVQDGYEKVKEYNPHIKQTTTITLEVYKNEKDEELLHKNTIEKKIDVSASTLLLGTAVTIGTLVLIKSLLDNKGLSD